MSARGARLRARRTRIAALVLALGVGVVALGAAVDGNDAARRAPATVATGPDCRHVRGEELAANARWRVVHTGDGGEFGTDHSPTPIVACDVRKAGPARVRVLGMAKLTGGGEDYVAEGGPYVEGGAIGRDLVLLDRRFYGQLGNDGGFRESGFTTLYDLHCGASSRLAGDWLQHLTPRGDTLVDHTLEATLTSDDALLTVLSQQDGRGAPVRLGPVTVWDVGGRRVLRGRVDRVTPRSAADDGSAFPTAIRVDGRPVAPRGPATTSELPVDSKLAWRAMPRIGGG